MADVISYLQEFGIDFGRDETSREAENEIIQKINQMDVVVFSKTGCGFCARAMQMLNAERSSNSFSLEAVIATSPEIRKALGRLLQLSDITFPQIVVRGRYIGGSDNLRELLEQDYGSFQHILRESPNIKYNLESTQETSNGRFSAGSNKKQSPITIMWYPPLYIQSTRPNLFAVPGGGKKGKWYHPQWLIHSNFVRYISIVHILTMVVCFVLYTLGTQYHDKRLETAANVLIILFCFDLLTLVTHAPAPFSPSGVLATYYGWRYRGDTTASLPYKFVFAAYLFTLIPLLGVSISARSTGDNTSSSIAMKTALVGLLINSTLLAVLRF